MKKSCFKGRICSKAFTLIELLVVVLIIGILAAVALPQYQKAVEKSRMAEAIILLRSIATAHQLYYLEQGTYLGATDIDKLDIEIPGVSVEQFAGRIKTKYFVYSPGGSDLSDNKIANAVRLDAEGNRLYTLFVRHTAPTKFTCIPEANASSIQKQLCEQLSASGVL